MVPGYTGMEPLYGKLYDKYARLKAKKFSELDAANKEQEVKFLTCIAAAEELIQHLRKENESLRDKVDELMTSRRSAVDEPSLDYQKLLMEEIEKNKELSEEVEELRRLQREGNLLTHDHRENDSGQVSLPGGARDGINLNHVSVGRSAKKRRRSSDSDVDGKVLRHVHDKMDTAIVHVEKDFQEEAVSRSAHQDAQKPDCHVRAEEVSGEQSNGHSTTECLFRALTQCILGLKFSVAQAQEIRVTALHESSGYSFTLTWLRNNGDVDLMYNVVSLGTLERIAPEWMREVIRFSMSMCPLFFERIANITRSRGTFR